MSVSKFTYSSDLLKISLEPNKTKQPVIEVSNDFKREAKVLDVCDDDGKQDSFDKLLSTLWTSAQTKGLFRYQLKELPFKVLDGKYRFVLQLNPDRAQKRRKPQEIASVNQPFSPDEFNFNKVKQEEVLLQLLPKLKGSEVSSNSEVHFIGEHLLLINVSPLEFGHVLLTPFRNKCRPQTVSPDGLKLAIELVLLSHSSDFRVGFNSLCGYASVNHEHYHAYYLKHRLYLESAHLNVIKEPCYEINDYPGRGFAFVLKALNELKDFVANVLKLTTYFQTNEVAHNIFITRGSTHYQKDHFDCLIVYVWARASSFGAKECEGFNPALCELGGHFPCKNESSYATLTEDSIIQILGDICKDSYASIRSIINDIL